jgi:hypothetical protein
VTGLGVPNYAQLEGYMKANAAGGGGGGGGAADPAHLLDNQATKVTLNGLIIGVLMVLIISL